MEDLVRLKTMTFADIYRSKKVFITGHTGFKGSWLTQWLLDLGAAVTGYALPPTTQPSIFEQIELKNKIKHIESDIRDFESLKLAIEYAKPDFIFHLAAQPLVRLSYEKPVETYSTNVMGTVNILEAVRVIARPCVVVVITTDKCYENSERSEGYSEDDPMGGHDPYSSSKGATELVVSAYRRSYFSNPVLGIRLASVRAGNVIGGGDWALDRIVPDCIRALTNNKPIAVRNKLSTRPWQHVLEPLSGYLWLAACLYRPDISRSKQNLDSAFNFGPTADSNRNVQSLVEEILKSWEGSWIDKSDPSALHEAKLLHLVIDKAANVLGWKPVWNFEETIYQTISWYKNEKDLGVFTQQQIANYTIQARARDIVWAR